MEIVNQMMLLMMKQNQMLAISPVSPLIAGR